MSGILETIKKIYTDKNATSKHLILFGMCLIYMFLSTIFDIKFKNFYTSKQNPIDFMFSLFLSLYSIQFITNSFKPNADFIPPISKIDWKKLIPMIIINTVWTIYLATFFIIGIILYFSLPNSIYFLYVGLVSIALLAPFFYFLYIALADNISTKKLLNIMLIFKFVKAAFIPYWKQILKTIFVSLIILVLYFAIYITGTFFNLDSISPINKDYALYDVFMFPVIFYCIIIIWSFVFPYTVLKIYTEKIKPIFYDENSQERLSK